jgi:hypothetical protein
MRAPGRLHGPGLQLGMEGSEAKSSNRAGKVNVSAEHEQGIKGAMLATPWHGIAWAHSPNETEQILTRHRSIGPDWRPNNSPEK